MRIAALASLAATVALGLPIDARAQSDALAVIHNSGHSNSINALAISPDDRWIASGSDDTTIRVWDRTNGRLLRTLTGHGQKVTWLRALPDGRQLVSLSEDATARVWDASTGALLRTIGGLKSAVNDYIQPKGALSADGKFLFSNSADAIRRIDLATGAVQQTYPRQGMWANWQTFALSPDDALIAAAHTGAVNAPQKYGVVGSQVKLLDAATGRLVRVLGTHDARESVTAMSFSQDGRLVASGGYNGIARVWEVATGRLLFTLDHAQHPSNRYVHSISFSRDARRIVTVGGPDGIKLWSAENGKLLGQFRGEPYEWSNVALHSTSGNFLASASGQTITLTNASDGTRLPVSFGQTDAQTVTISTLPDGLWLTAGVYGLALWNSTTAQLEQNLTRETIYLAGPTQFQGRDAGGRTLVLSSLYPALKLAVRDAVTGSLVQTLDWGPRPKADKPCPNCPDYTLHSFVISPDGRHVAASLFGDATTVRVWDLATGRLKHGLPAKAYRKNGGGGAYNMAFSADSRSLVVQNLDAQVKDTIRIFDIESGKETASYHLPVQNGVGQASSGVLVTSPDGRWLATTFYFYTRSFDTERTVALLDLRTGQLVRTFRAAGVGNEPAVVRFSTDGKSLFVGTAQGNKVNQWETESGRLVRTFEGSPGSPQSIAISPDDRRLIVGNSNGTSGVWDIDSGNRLAVSLQTGEGEWVSITPEGFFAASANGAQLLHVVQGLAATGIDQLYQSLYRPDLVREKLAGDPRGLVRQAAASLDLNKVFASGNAPDVRLTLPGRALGPIAATSMPAEAEITDRGGGIGRVEWRLNGVTVGIDTAPAVAAAPVRLARELALDAGDNTIEVVAYNAANLIASVPARLSVTTAQPAPPSIAPVPPSTPDSPRPTPAVAAKPRLFVMVAGVDDYAERRIKLSYAVSDAREIARGFREASGNIYQAVEVRLLTDAEVTKDSLDAAFSEMAGKTTTSDMFLLYLAGHGKTVDGRYYFIPQDFAIGGEFSDKAINAAVKVRGIAQDQWQRWFASVPARRSLILFDTCDSGTLAGDETQELERTAANERLAQATGRSILAASGGSEEAIEGYRGHGLFTYNVLDAIFRSDGDDSGTVELNELAAYVYGQVSELSQKIFKRRQVPQMKITGNYPLAKPTRILTDEAVPVAENKPAVQVAQTAQLQVQPGSGATVVRSLSASTKLAVLESRGGWSLVAADGKPLGYVATRDLAPAQ
jgi:WD40 repeat protein/uncharacterized caspase-like protein